MHESKINNNEWMQWVLYIKQKLMKTGQIKQHMRTTKQNNKKANRIRKRREEE